jgi:hypothetical protein
MGLILFLAMEIPFSVIIHYLDIPGVSIFPMKADSPTIIDSDAPLPFPISRQLLQPVAWRRAQKIETCRSIELRQLTFCLAANAFPFSWTAT